MSDARIGESVWVANPMSVACRRLGHTRTCNVIGFPSTAEKQNSKDGNNTEYYMFIYTYMYMTRGPRKHGSSGFSSAILELAGRWLGGGFPLAGGRGGGKGGGRVVSEQVRPCERIDPRRRGQGRPRETIDSVESKLATMKRWIASRARSTPCND